jgi:hypothetical protein
MGRLHGDWKDIHIWKGGKKKRKKGKQWWEVYMGYRIACGEG